MPNDNAEQLQTEQAKAADRVRQQVEDALELSRYVVATGQTDKDGKPFAFGDIELIQGAAVSLGLLDVKPGAAAGAAAAGTFDTAAWNAFEGAYYRLAIATHPVTAETLRNTRYSAGAGATRSEFLAGKWRDASPAQRFTWKLWGFTIAFAISVLVTEALINWLGVDGDLSGWSKVVQGSVTGLAALGLRRPRRLRLSPALQVTITSTRGRSICAAHRNTTIASCSVRCPAAPSSCSRTI